MRRLALGFAIVAVLVAPASSGVSFPGANGNIVYSAYSKTDPPVVSIWTTRPDGSFKTMLASPGDQPAVSADGTKIAFVANGIWVMNADGSDQHLLPNTADATGPAWSRSGKQLAFTRTVPCTLGIGCEIGEDIAEIYKMNADGSGQVALTTEAQGENSRPEWAPAGGLIAFGSTRDGGLSQLYVMRGDGTHARRVLEAPTANDGDPTWSPDGTQLAFRRDAQTIARVRLDGTGLVALRTGTLAKRSPTWSPNGNRIALAEGSIISFNSAVVSILASDGSGAKTVAAQTVPGYPFPTANEPSWGPAPAP